mgnify:CR=1 FL=1
MNVKKIIKGIIGLGAMGGVAYAAYKLGEKNGEVNERFRQKYDEDDDFPEYDYDDDDEDEEPDADADEPPDNYYGTCFEPRYDEPDDGCTAPDSDGYVEPHEDFFLDNYEKCNSLAYDENCKSDDHFYSRLRNIDPGNIPMPLMLRAFAIVKEFSWITNTTLLHALDCSYQTCDDILNIFEKAGYVSKKNYKFRRRVYIKNMSLENLI